jgi:hypothetical protein
MERVAGIGDVGVEISEQASRQHRRDVQSTAHGGIRGSDRS